jgi:hypothetical protein
MKRILILCACLSALVLGACSSESKLPNPTGKGSIRAVNAIPGSPQMRFLIEERSLGSVAYKQTSGPFNYDDFEYNFNFEIFLPGEFEPTRVATQLLKVEKDREHTLVVTGDYLNPAVTVWTSDKREWSEGATAFEFRVAHLIESQRGESIDVYFDEAVEPAVINNRIATLAYGEVANPQDFEAGEYILTITAAGDINNVLYTSATTTPAERNAYLAMTFDGTANDISPIVVGLTSDIGAGGQLQAAGSSPTARFVHAAYSLPTADIYDDDVLTNRIVPGLALGDATADLDVSGDLETYYWTPADSTATILFEDEFATPAGSRVTLYAVGATDEWLIFPAIWDRSSIATYAKLNLFNAALDNDVLDVYVLPAGETIDEEDSPTLRAVFAPAPAPTGVIVGGDYDLFVTAVGERTALAPALPINVANGDVVDVLVLDTADPNVPEVKQLPPP